MKSFQLILLQFILGVTIIAQDIPIHTSAEQRNKAIGQHENIRSQSEFANIESKCIGPTVFSGRVVDLAVNPSDPSIFYVAYATGGLWKTESNGTRFTPIFDNQGVITIGAIAVDWSNDRIWVGTGEVNSSRSSYAGNGVYYSDNDGKSWNHTGLSETHHIGRIIIDPERKDRVYVAALGHLYSDNMERGIFITDDGGKNWNHTLSIDDKTGAVDLIVDSSDSDVLYAAMWERKRFAWNFIESGEGSGIYKSKDKGKTWSCVSGGDSGFPNGKGVGRIGLSSVKTENGSRIYALLDNYNRRPKEDTKDKGLVKDDFKTMDEETFFKLDDDRFEEYLRENGFPKKYDAKSVKKLIRSDEVKITDLASYLEDANRMLFDTPVIGAEVYYSDDQGTNWNKTHDDYIDNLYYSYGYYFGQIRANPIAVDEFYIMGVPILRTEDAGKTFKNINGDNVHVDHHALWVNPNRKGHLINGNDGGINISYDNGESWYKCNSPAVGQFYYINVDMEEPYNVYGGTQDNGVWKGSHKYKASDRWHNIGKYPYQTIMGGDGMQVQIDSRNNDLVYTGFQFGNYFKVNTRFGQREYITPKHDLGETPYRWNWQSPIHLSKHNEDILYMGANKLFRSLNKGASFEAISSDLTLGGKKGDVPYGTLSSIHESPLKFGLLYAGSDDGLVHVSKNGGYSWELITKDLPKNMWVSRVQASAHDEATVYLSLNAYRWDNFESMVYRSTDYGSNWKKIGTNLPDEPVNVIKEDPFNPKVLYVGTDHGTYISTDSGSQFYSISNNIPSTPVHDLVIHHREGDLLIGTHGRSIYKVDMDPFRYWIDSTGVNQLDILSDINIKYNENWGNKKNIFSDVSEPEVKLQVYSTSSGEYKLDIKNEDDKSLKSVIFKLDKGFNILSLELSIDKKNTKFYKGKTRPEKKDNGKYYLLEGKYSIQMNNSVRSLIIE